MTSAVLLRDYDFAAARTRLGLRVDGMRRVVRAPGGGLDFERTRTLRELGGVDDAILGVEVLLVAALCDLPVSEGGLVVGGKALATAMSTDQPLVQALLILGGHPNHPGYTHQALAASGRAVPNDWRNTPHDAGPFLAAQRRWAWSVAALEGAVQAGALAAYGDVQVRPDRVTSEQAPGSKLGSYLRILGASTLYDAIGAWEPAFTQRHALVGEWWLLQPVSPRLDHVEVAWKAGLELRGFLPQAHVDARGRVVMVCFPRDDLSDEARIERIEESKWISGWRHVVWTNQVGPLADERFELLEELEGVTDDSYGVYRHSTELPPYTQAALQFGPDGGAHAQQLAQAVLEALDAPEDPNAAALDAQNDRRKARIAEASYLRTGQAQPKPPRTFAGPARTLAELKFAAALERCSRCDDRLDPSSMVARAAEAGTWTVSGTCLGCRKPRSHTYQANASVESASHAPYELGEGPSRMLSAAQFEAALSESAPLVAPQPERLDFDERRLSTEANLAALVSLHELAKLEDLSVDRVKVVLEKERQLTFRRAHERVR